MAIRFVKGQELLHVSNLASNTQLATVRDAHCLADVDSKESHVVCWIPAAATRQVLPVFELYPNTQKVCDDLNALEARAAALRAEYAELTAAIYKLRNSLAA